MSSARPAQAVCGARSSVPLRTRQARTSASAQSQPPQQRAVSQRVSTGGRPAALRPGAPVLLSKSGLLAHRRGALVVARAGDGDDEPLTATQEIPIFPLGLCAHPMGEGAVRTRLKAYTCGGTVPRPCAVYCGTQRRPLGVPVRLGYGATTRAAGTLKRAGSPAPLAVCTCLLCLSCFRLSAVFQCL